MRDITSFKPLITCVDGCHLVYTNRIGILTTKVDLHQISRVKEADFHCQVSYWKCWKGGELANAMIMGTPQKGYALLETYRYVLQDKNQ